MDHHGGLAEGGDLLTRNSPPEDGTPRAPPEAGGALLCETTSGRLTADAKAGWLGAWKFLTHELHQGVVLLALPEDKEAALEGIVGCNPPVHILLPDVIQVHPTPLDGTTGIPL